MTVRPQKAQACLFLGEEFDFDPNSRRLRRRGRVIKLERIPSELLLLLIEQRGTVVTRDQIVERIWGRDVFLDTDNSINGAIRKIRQALKDDPEKPDFIQTISGKGYRFFAPVSEEPASADPIAPPPGTPDPQNINPLTPALPVPDIVSTELPSSEPTSGEFRRKVFTLLVPALLVMMTAVLGWLVGSRNHSVKSAPGRTMLAVLPFENLTGDPEQEYFSDGLTEELISQLGSVNAEGLGVIAPTSVMNYKATNKPVTEIGRRLNAQYVLEGSVRHDANVVRITAKLIRTSNQTQIWTREYSREGSGLLSLEGEIAREIADEIKLTFTNTKAGVLPALPTRNYEAYDQYLKGLYFFNKRSQGDLSRAITHFEKATELDPNFALAYVGLADSYTLIGGYSGEMQTGRVEKARAAVLRALQLDDNLAEAHTALALIVQNYDLDWQTSEREFRRAIQLNPNYATAHHWYAEHLMWMGRFDEALAESERARQLDPLSLIVAADKGAILFYSRQYDAAIKQFQSVLEMDPRFTRAHIIASAYAQKGMYKEALRDLEQWSQDGPWYWSTLAAIYGQSGDKAHAKAALRHLLKLSRTESYDPAVLARAYLAVGDKERALKAWEKAYTEHSGSITDLRVDPTCDALRDDPRFQSLLRRAGLGDSMRSSIH